MKQPAPSASLRRVLSLPAIVFYGLGVTVGAGIFALIGEIIKISGNLSPVAFLVAGLTAGATGWSYALLVRLFPRAGGEAIYVSRGLGQLAGQLAGLGVVITGIVSSAVIALAFAGYLSAVVAIPTLPASLGLIAILGLVAWWGVRESIWLAAIITIMETGTLILVAAFGVPDVIAADLPFLEMGATPIAEQTAMVLSGSVIAFFAFIGFEDMVNMAEETKRPETTMPKAILITLSVTLVLYLGLSTIAVSIPEKDAIASSSAPMATLFEAVSGMSGQPVAVISALAMVNGILVQIIMAARVLYGMANDGQLPGIFATVDRRRKTPVVATAFVCFAVIGLAASFDLTSLAELTSLVTLLVFTLVNLALFAIGVKIPQTGLGRWRWWGLFAALPTALILGWQVTQLF